MSDQVIVRGRNVVWSDWENVFLIIWVFVNDVAKDNVFPLGVNFD
jgi:hypothetical protein